MSKTCRRLGRWVSSSVNASSRKRLALRSVRTIVHASSSTPIVIAESATLKAGQCQLCQWKSRKSTT